MILKIVNWIPNNPIIPKVQIQEITIGIKVRSASSILPNENRSIKNTIIRESLTNKLKSSFNTRTRLSVIYFLSNTTKSSEWANVS